MSGLRQAAERIAAMGRFPAPRPDRASAIEKAAARLADRPPSGRAREAEGWDDFLRRIGLVA